MPTLNRVYLAASLINNPRIPEDKPPRGRQRLESVWNLKHGLGIETSVFRHGLEETKDETRPKDNQSSSICILQVGILSVVCCSRRNNFRRSSLLFLHFIMEGYSQRPETSA